MRIKTLYEGILADMDDTLQAGDDVADSVWLNGEDSPMRKMFGRNNGDEKIFTVETNSGKKQITCDAPGVIGVPFRIDGEQNLSNIISDVNEIVCIGGCTIMGNGNTVVTDKTLCDKITADIVNIEKVKKLDGINMDVRSMRAYAKYVPTIGTDDTIKEISNCHLDVTGMSKITLKAIPKFTNVSSDTINFVEMPLRTMGATDWNKVKFAELFEFDYELTIFDSKSSTTAKIKKMGDLNKLIASKDFYGRYYSDWPYHLRPGVKLCDVFDVSKFKQLKRVAVWGKTMGLIFENTKSGCDTADVFHSEMLKQYYMSRPEYHKTDFESNIPVTADGWRVFLVRL